MESIKEGKPKAIRTVGIVLTVFSSLTIISSLLGLLMANHLTGGTYEFEGVAANEQAVAYIRPIAIIQIALSLCFLVAGIFIIRYNNWGRVLVQAAAVPSLIFLCYTYIFIEPMNAFDKGEFGIEQVIGILLSTTPIILLIWYLNRENVKNHFA